MLGVLPLDSRIRVQGDSGKPIFLAEPHSAIADTYRSIAEKVSDQLAVRSKTQAFQFPKIIIEKK